MAEEKRPWFLLSSHGLCLVFVFLNPEARLSEIATAVGLTERRTTQIVRDLEGADFLIVEYQGRRKRYAVNGAALARHPLFSDIPLGKSMIPALSMIAKESSKGGSASAINRDTVESRLEAIKRRQEELTAEYEALLKQLEDSADSSGDVVSVC